MFDVSSIAVFCSEFIECFPAISFKFFLKLLATIPVVPIITAIIIIIIIIIIVVVLVVVVVAAAVAGVKILRIRNQNGAMIYISLWRPLRLTQLFSGTAHSAPEDLVVLLQLLREK